MGKDKDCVEMGVDRDAVYLWDQENASVSYPVEISVHLRKPFLNPSYTVLRDVYNCSSQVLATEEKKPQNKN